MTKFAGKVGFAPVQKEIPEGSGNWKIVPVEHRYRGEILKTARTLEDGTKVNNDITVQNSISIVANAFAREHFFDMLYVEWQGVLWKVDSVDASQPPRLVLRLGGRYNGPKT
jgi:hypothetical protein